MPVMAAVTAAVRIFAPPRPLGTWINIVPCSSVRSRVPALKLKLVSGPIRVSVLSSNNSSERDFIPVLSPISSLMISLIEAAWLPLTGSTTCTSRMILYVRLGERTCLEKRSGGKRPGREKESAI